MTFARDKRSISCVWFAHGCARATWAYVLETVRGVVKRLQKISNSAFECDYYCLVLLLCFVSPLIQQKQITSSHCPMTFGIIAVQQLLFYNWICWIRPAPYIKAFYRSTACDTAFRVTGQQQLLCCNCYVCFSCCFVCKPLEYDGTCPGYCIIGQVNHFFCVHIIGHTRKRRALCKPQSELACQSETLLTPLVLALQLWWRLCFMTESTSFVQLMHLPRNINTFLRQPVTCVDPWSSPVDAIKLSAMVEAAEATNSAKEFRLASEL